MLSFFFFNDTATTEIYTLSLHDALPIAGAGRAPAALRLPRAPRRIVQVPQPDGADLEHLAVPLPQPGRRLRPHPGRHAGARQGWQEIRRLPEQSWLRSEERRVGKECRS